MHRAPNEPRLLGANQTDPLRGLRGVFPEGKESPSLTMSLLALLLAVACFDLFGEATSIC